jgi:hypothetical protein
MRAAVKSQRFPPMMNSMSPLRVLIATVLVAACALLAACGSSDSTPTGPEGQINDICLRGGGEDGICECVSKKLVEIGYDDDTEIANLNLQAAQIQQSGNVSVFPLDVQKAIRDCGQDSS